MTRPLLTLWLAALVLAGCEKAPLAPAQSSSTLLASISHCDVYLVRDGSNTVYIVVGTSACSVAVAHEPPL